MVDLFELKEIDAIATEIVTSYQQNKNRSFLSKLLPSFRYSVRREAQIGLLEGIVELRYNNDEYFSGLKPGLIYSTKYRAFKSPFTVQQKIAIILAVYQSLKQESSWNRFLSLFSMHRKIRSSLEITMDNVFLKKGVDLNDYKTMALGPDEHLTSNLDFQRIYRREFQTYWVVREMMSVVSLIKSFEKKHPRKLIKDEVSESDDDDNTSNDNTSVDSNASDESQTLGVVANHASKNRPLPLRDLHLRSAARANSFNKMCDKSTQTSSSQTNRKRPKNNKY